MLTPHPPEDQNREHESEPEHESEDEGLEDNFPRFEDLMMLIFSGPMRFDSSGDPDEGADDEPMNEEPKTPGARVEGCVPERKRT